MWWVAASSGESDRHVPLHRQIKYAMLELIQSLECNSLTLRSKIALLSEDSPEYASLLFHAFPQSRQAWLAKRLPFESNRIAVGELDRASGAASCLMR